MPQANILFLFCSINLQLKSKPEKTFAGRKTVCLFFSNWIGHNWIRLRSMLSEISSDIADMQCWYIVDVDWYMSSGSLYIAILLNWYMMVIDTELLLRLNAGVKVPFQGCFYHWKEYWWSHGSRWHFWKGKRYLQIFPNIYKKTF